MFLTPLLSYSGNCQLPMAYRFCENNAPLGNRRRRSIDGREGIKKCGPPLCFLPSLVPHLKHFLDWSDSLRALRRRMAVSA